MNKRWEILPIDEKKQMSIQPPRPRRSKVLPWYVRI